MLETLLQAVLTLDQSLTQWVAAYGAWAIGLVAIIVFAETGLVVMPFLPGDSLLFLTGAAVAAGGLNVHGAVAVLIAAAVAGDALNFAIGRRVAGPVVASPLGRWIRPSHLELTHQYFERFGGLTIVVARFVPIVRTFAPFLAGAGDMSYRRFAAFNVIGAVAWVGGLVYAGAAFGQLAFVRENLGLLTVAIVVVSLLPLAMGVLRARLRARSAATP
jgi:membrane-associated protein